MYYVVRPSLACVGKAVVELYVSVTERCPHQLRPARRTRQGHEGKPGIL